MKSELSKQYDVIFIGSGIGPLTAAAILARRKGWRCLLLERHYRAGGFTHVFDRKGWHWDVGIHYIGGMQPGGGLFQLMKYISDGSLRWNRMPEEFDVFEYPDMRFRVPSHPDRFREQLKDLFPGESKAIDRYFHDLRKAAGWVRFYMLSRLLPGPFGMLMRGMESLRGRLALQTTGQYLTEHFKDERLRALLVSQWGDYGLPPSRSSFFIHSLIASHYFEGGWYPEGGGTAICDGILPGIQRAGGAVAVNHTVEEILLDARGAARGVRVRRHQGRHEETLEFEAPVIISGAGALNTYTKLFREPPPFAEPLRELSTSDSAVTLYLGFRESPARLGFKGENYWMYSSHNHDRIASAMEDLLAGRPQMAFLSFPSLKDPAATKHTGEIITFASYDPFAPYAAEPWRNRGAEYEALKARIARGLLDFVEERHPGLRELVEFKELSTPLSVGHFTDFPRGSIYGLPATPERYRQRWLSPRTPVPGLYLTGADVVSLGIGGAMMGGVFTASMVLGGAAFPAIMRDAMKA